MKSNPTVYPYTPFRYLTRPQPTSTFLSLQKVDKAEIVKIIEPNRIPEVSIQGRTVPERILSIFLSPEVRFGPREYITSCKNEWIEKIEQFTNRQKTVQFTILGFPFKTPVLLKTNRRYPDLGEVLALKRLAHLMRLVRKVYRPGGVVTVFTEGPFAPFAGVTKAEAGVYYRQLVALNRQFGFQREVKLVNLGALERFVPRFKHALQSRVAAFRRLYRKKDKEFMAKYRAAFSSVFRIVNTRKLPLDALRQVYADNTRRLSKQLAQLKRKLEQRTNEAILHYLAYLKVRDDFKLIERFRPGALPLTVSPKSHRLGIIPIDRKVKILHTHGVPVYRAASKSFIISYIYDLRRTGKKYTPVFLLGDRERKPFYYIEH